MITKLIHCTTKEHRGSSGELIEGTKHIEKHVYLFGIIRLFKSTVCDKLEVDKDEVLPMPPIGLRKKIN
jgi:hypothetical protein